jgi:hypothetical protein
VAPIRQLLLTNFKAFERYTVTFPRSGAFLVGPNNAGKSTVLAAMRAAANMIRLAARRRATDTRMIDGTIRYGHIFTGDQVGLVDENLQHEFTQAETRLQLDFGRDQSIEAVWPPTFRQDGGFFFVRDSDVVLRQPADVRKVFPAIGMVPVLSPLDQEEDLLTPKYVRASFETRLASRHFRNQLRVLEFDGDLSDFRGFVEEWLPEIRLESLSSPATGASEPAIDLYYSEPHGRVDREIFWVGDGMQIWLQVLLHVFRHKEADVILLDEPDVFLHADLQRRLVRLLEEQSAFGECPRDLCDA